MTMDCLRFARGLFIVVACIAVLAASGCRMKVARSEPAPAKKADVVKEEPAFVPAWEHLALNVVQQPGAVGDLDSSGAAIRPAAFDVPASDAETMASARNELRLRVEELAEAQIARAKVEMEQNAAVRLDSHRRELLAAIDRERAERGADIANERWTRVRDFDVESLGRRVNLGLKKAAAKTQLGLFDSGVDSATGTKIESLKSEIDRLDEQRVETMLSGQIAEAREIAALEQSQKARMDAEIAQLRKALDDHIQQESKALRDRLKADLAEGVFGMSLIDKSSRYIEAGADKSSQSLRDEKRVPKYKIPKYNDSAERRFQTDLAEAKASIHKRQEEINRRRDEDS
ncbi:MAG: hypothetical protein Q7N50_11765, partial [Armatimonadota bacterium]|nr:hypothetical protein [Armatimonadota bacterium]